MIRFTFIPHSATECGSTYRHRLPSVTKCIRVHLAHITDIPFHGKLSIFYGNKSPLPFFKRPIQLWSCFMHLLQRRHSNVNKIYFQRNFQKYNIQCNIVTWATLKKSVPDARKISISLTCKVEKLSWYECCLLVLFPYNESWNLREGLPCYI